MNFYNFFTNFNVDPETISTTHPIQGLFKLLIDDQNNYYSASPYEFPENRSTLVEHFASPQFVRTLNPTLFKENDERTLPIINFLIRNNSTRNTFNQNNPMVDFLIQLNPTTINRHTNVFDQVTKTAYKNLFSVSSIVDPTRLFNHYNSSPNQTFLTLLKEFKNTHEISKTFSLNKEIHKNFLEDGYVCWVDSFEDSLILNNSDLVSPVMNLAKYYVATLQHVLDIKNNTTDQTQRPNQNLGLEIWNKLLQIDNSPNFSHLDFERPTQTLLLLEEKEIQNYIDMFLSLKVFNYLKMNTLIEINDNPESEENSTTIYSHFSTEFFNKFREDIKNPQQIDNNNLQIIQTPPTCMQIAPSYSHEYQWEFAAMFDNTNNTRSPVNILPPKDNNSTYIPLGGTSGILFHNSAKHPDDKFYNLNILESFNQNPNKRITGLILNRFTKANNKQSLQFVSLTKKQSLIRKGFFIPVLLRMLTCNKDCELEISYNFSLLNHSDAFHQVKKRRRSRTELKSFIQDYDQDGLKIVNYEDFLKQQAERMKDLSEYSIVNSNTFAEFNPNDISTMIKNLAKTKESMKQKVNYSVAEFSDKITSRLIVNPAVVKKYSKVNNSYTKLLNQNDQAKQTFIESAQSLALTQQGIQNTLNQIKAFQERIKEYKQDFIASNEAIRSSFNKRVDLVKTLCANKSLYLKVNERYQNAVNVALKQNNYASNNFFKNLYNNEAIKILSIKANNDSDCIQANQSAQTLETFSSMVVSKEKDFLIQEVVFLIDKPVKILVDAGKKGEVAAGPYLVKVSKNRIEIALAYPSSIHGNNDSGAIFIHPHASSTSLNGLLGYFSDQSRVRYSNGCLGEASALIYKAFEKNDLKTIIISALTWVRNANSADPWGRNYKYFPLYSEMVKGKPSLTEQDEEVLQHEITEEEVDDFINTMIEQSIDHAIHEPMENQQVLQTEENIEPEQEQTNVQPAAGIENFNTNEAYIPYAQR